MSGLSVRPIVLAAALAALATTAVAQGKPGTGHASATPAKELFAGKARPTQGPATSIGFYTRGCLSGAVALPIDGPHWQVMRLSRNRNWGHPSLVRMIEHLANKLPQVGGWQGILVGDMSQPRGGPMFSDHASHEVGLDVDIWVTPYPDHKLTRAEREDMAPMNVLTKDWNDINRDVWSPQHVALYKAAAEEPDVERVLLNPAIKKALCRDVKGDRSWLRKLRPWYGHQDHIHVRLRCPPGDHECKPQPPVPPGEGCDKSLDWWFTKAAREPPKKPTKPKPPIMLADLPKARTAVLNAP
jgi:penicillin-insensitive murein endopeptidase